MKVLRRIGISVLLILFLAVGLCFGQNTAEQSHIKGVEYGAKGKFEEAKEQFQKALKVDPFYIPAKMCLKVIEDANKQKIKSKTAVHLFKGAAHFSKGEWNKAISDFTKAIEINPRYAEAYYNRGVVYMVKLGDKKKACSDWKRACELGECRNYEIAKRKGDSE